MIFGWEEGRCGWVVEEKERDEIGGGMEGNEGARAREEGARHVIEPEDGEV